MNIAITPILNYKVSQQHKKKVWLKAMKEEIKMIEKNETWELVT